MSSVASGPAGSGRSWGARIIWLILAVIAAYYILTTVVNYITFNEEKVGPYFWPRVNMVAAHAVSGSLALILGFFQFWPWLRNNHKKIHRMGGRGYLIAIMIGSATGYALAFTSSVHVVYAGGLAGLATAWLVTGVMAFLAIRNRNISQHKEWMIRSYVVTFGFVFFRIGDDVMQHFGIMSFPDSAMFLSWACWAIPLLFAEAAIQWKQVTRKAGARV